jgi:hypothetical protein
MMSHSGLEMLISFSINECDPTFLCPMKKSSLAFLSSPALLAAYLLSVSPTYANTNESKKNNQDGDPYVSTVVITRDNPTLDLNSQSEDDRTNVLTSDRIGDLAISNRGCDCMGCRQAVLSLFSK